MDRYIGDIIDDERHDTRNVDEEAHSDANMLRYNQYAEKSLYGKIMTGYSWLFEKTIETSIVADQDEYTVNDNLAYGTRITNVEYKAAGSTRYYPLQVTPDRYRTLLYSGYPRMYRRRHGSIVIEPVPENSQGTLRITYERALDRLALRVAQVNGTPANATIAVDNEDATYTPELVSPNYICITDAYGEPLLYNGVVSSFSSPTITLTADVEDYLVTGKTLADLDNAWVTVGKYSTTHSALPNEAEAYLIEWVNLKLHNIDSSDQFQETNQVLKDISNSIVASLKMPDKARKRFPIDDFDLLITDV